MFGSFQRIFPEVVKVFFFFKESGSAIKQSTQGGVWPSLAEIHSVVLDKKIKNLKSLWQSQICQRQPTEKKLRKAH